MIVVTDLSLVHKPTAVALGNFDGIHRGHQKVIEPILNRSGLVSTVVSFNPHPREFFGRHPSPLLLTPLPEKATQLERLGVQQFILLPFTTALSQLRPEAFIVEVLEDLLQVAYLSVGFNFRFGYQRQGGLEDLRAVWGDRLHVTEEQQIAANSPVRISSSAIRTALAMGDVVLATRLLGRRYSLKGTVVPGNQIGRKIGFPTANLEVHPQKFLPKDGVYSVLVSGHRGVMNIGVRPTIGGTPHRTIEVHLLEWQGNLYDQEITVELVQFLRGERKFESFEELKVQIQKDCEQAEKALSEI